MDINKINKNLKTEFIGRKLIYYDSVDSTNRILYELAESGLDEGAVLCSDTQTDGKGRLGRNWYSPGGVNLYLSVLLRPEVSPQNSAVFTFIASLALAETIEDLSIPCSIKWPNDILVKDKKVAGVLTEMKNEGNSLEFIIIGIGLNINMPREIIDKNLEEISESVTSLNIEKGINLNREEIAVALIRHLDKYYLKFKTEGINSIVAEWCLRWGLLNEKISVKVDTEIVSGIARKVDNSGFLYIEDAVGNLKKIIAGDIEY